MFWEEAFELSEELKKGRYQGAGDGDEENQEQENLYRGVESSKQFTEPLKWLLEGLSKKFATTTLALGLLPAPWRALAGL